MAEDRDQERSHAPSPLRLERARKEGQVARSRDLTGALLLLAGAALALAAGSAVSGWFAALLRRGLSIDRGAAFDAAAALSGASVLVQQALGFVLPGLVALAVVAILAPLAVGGWLFTGGPLAPDAMRLSPARWVRQTFSARGALELTKTLAKAFLVSGAALAALWMLRENLAALLAAAAGDAIAGAVRLSAVGFLAVASAMALIAAVDVPAQHWQHQRELRMSTDEVRREAKETEGDPLLKQRIRGLQREAARRRMMADVPGADVVVVNPEHYAVALAWSESRMRAPRIVAKGVDLVAARIRELAEEHGVPVLEAPPLARALHRHANLGDEIPAALYQAVAQVLAWTYALRAGRAVAAGPGEIEVPPELDPRSEAGVRT